MNRLSFDVTLDNELLSQDEFVESEKNESCISYLKELPRKKSGKYSLSDALAEIKYLKRQVSLRDEDIAFLTLQVNKLTGQIPYETCSWHKMTGVDGIINQGIANMDNFIPIAFERYHAHALKHNSFANVLPYEPTLVQVNSNNAVPQVSFDRESSNLDNSMGYLLADDTLLCNFTHIIDDHDLNASNFHSSQYTRANLILEFSTRQKWQLELLDHVSKLASEISIVEHTMSTMKLHQHRSYYALLEHIIQVQELCLITEARRDFVNLLEENNSNYPGEHQNDLITHLHYLLSEYYQLQIQYIFLQTELLNYEQLFSIILQEQVLLYQDYFNTKDKRVSDSQSITMGKTLDANDDANVQFEDESFIA